MRSDLRWEQAPVYISYRRSQSAADARHLHDMLEGRFGAGVSFLDVRDIPAGRPFPTVLDQQLRRCRVLLVVIGPDWLAASDPLSHRRRLDDPADWVFREVRHGLERDDCLVVPVLTGTHPMPRAAYLPPLLAGLAKLQARRLAHESWQRDFAALADQLAAELGPGPEPAVSEPSMRFMAAVVRSTIADTIGTKYIPTLYVSRGNLEASLLRHVNRSRVTRTAEALDEDRERLEKAAARLIDVQGLPATEPVRTAVLDAVRDVRAWSAEMSREPLTNQDHIIRSTRIAAHVQVIQDAAQAHLRAIRTPSGAGRAARRGEEERRTTVNLLVRAAEQTGERARAVERAVRPVVAVVERAGRGKTNLLCDFAIRCAAGQPVVFHAARAIPPGRGELRAAVAASLNAVPGNDLDDLGSLGASFGRRHEVAVFIDGINENADPAGFARELRDVVRLAGQDNVRFVVTCREEYWPVFEPELRDLLADVHLNVLGKFGPEQYETAVDLYFRHFRISGEIVGEAREALHDPLLLRFFCEAYAHTRFGKTSAVTEIRRLPLFELYTARKIKQIADLHPEVGPTHVIDDYLEVLATFTAMRGQLSLSRQDVATVLPRGDTTSAGSVYRMLLDEDLIIEESLVDFDVRVGFVYEAFMEYVLSRTIRKSSDADPAENGIVWHREHARFINRIGVLGFYLAHLFTVDRAAFGRLVRYFDDEGGTASLSVIRLALENIDATQLEPADIAVVTTALVHAVCATGVIGKPEEDLEAVRGVLDGLARVGPASSGVLVDQLLVHADRLRDSFHPEFVWMLETLGDHDDRIRLVALWERLSMPDPTLGLKVRQVRMMEEVIGRDWPGPGLIFAALGRRWLTVASRPELAVQADHADLRLTRFRRLMRKITKRWRPERGALPAKLDDVVRLALAERPAATGRGAAPRRYHRKA